MLIGRTHASSYGWNVFQWRNLLSIFEMRHAPGGATAQHFLGAQAKASPVKARKSAPPVIPSFVGRHRCIRIPAQIDSGLPPVIILGGMAQTLSSWVGHLSAIAKKRDVIAVELRGQGPHNAALSVEDVRLEVQANDLLLFLDDAGLRDTPVDVIGFSFGGRAALAFAAVHPKRVRKVAITSVAGSRGGMGSVILEQWLALLRPKVFNDSLEPYAWASIMETHHPMFLARNQHKVKEWVKLCAETNTREGIEAIVSQTMGSYEASFAKVRAHATWPITHVLGPRAFYAAHVRLPRSAFGDAADIGTPPLPRAGRGARRPASWGAASSGCRTS